MEDWEKDLILTNLPKNKEVIVIPSNRDTLGWFDRDATPYLQAKTNFRLEPSPLKDFEKISKYFENIYPVDTNAKVMMNSIIDKYKYTNNILKEINGKYVKDTLKKYKFNLIRKIYNIDPSKKYLLTEIAIQSSEHLTINKLRIPFNFESSRDTEIKECKLFLMLGNGGSCKLSVKYGIESGLIDGRTHYEVNTIPVNNKDNQLMKIVGYKLEEVDFSNSSMTYKEMFKTGDYRDSLVLLNKIEDYFSLGKFNEVDMMLKDTDLNLLGPLCIITLVYSPFRFSSKLEHYLSFRKRATKRLRKLNENRLADDIEQWR